MYIDAEQPIIHFPFPYLVISYNQVTSQSEYDMTGLLHGSVSRVLLLALCLLEEGSSGTCINTT